VFNPRLRRGRAAKKKTAEETAGELEELEEPHEVGEAEHVGATGMLENPISAGGKHR
jgi:hypothetical protein